MSANHFVVKKAIKIIAIAVVLLLALLLIIPFAFKGKIMEAIKTEANRNLRAHLDFNDVSLSLIKNFPDFWLEINDLTISGLDDFEGDTLLYTKKLKLGIGLKSVFGAGPFELKAVKFNDPFLNLKALDETKVNWDITKPDEELATQEESSAPFKAVLRVMEIVNGRLVYDDATFPMLADLRGLSLRASGDLSAAKSELLAEATATNINLDYSGLRYLNHAKGQLSAKIGADLDVWKFSFEEAMLRINELMMKANGFFAMPDEGYDMDVVFETEKNDFRSFLSLIPALYSNNFSDLQAEGKLELNGLLKGLYSENTLPDFNLNIVVDNAMFRYASLPEAVKQIALSARISNAGNDMDATVIDVDKFHMELANNPIDIRLLAKTPLSDPYVDASISGKLNLEDIGRFYPLPADNNFSGRIEAALKAKGNISAIENQRFSDFEASGTFLASNIAIQNPALSENLRINEARLNLSPALAELPILKAAIGKNDISAQGKLENILPYAFGKAELKGKLDLSSNYLNINDFMPTQAENTQNSDSSAIAAIEVPEGIDFTLTGDFKKLIYDNMELDNVNGHISVKDKTLKFDRLSMNALEGSLLLNGTYSTQVNEKPALDIDLQIRDVDVQKAFLTFNTVKKLAPVAALTSGKISTQLRMKTDLDGAMMPVFSSFNGSGKLLSPALELSNVNSLNQLADLLKIEKYRKLVIEQINLSFDILDGKVFVKPVETGFGKTKAEFSGWNSFDQTMEYVLQLSIPRVEFGGTANAVLENMVASANKVGVHFTPGDVVPVTVLIGGTLSNPKVSTSLKTTANAMADQIKQQVSETLQQKKDEAEAKLREEALKAIAQANEKAQKLLAEAQKRADALVTTATETADRLKAETDKQALQLIAEGKKNGPIAELAAKKTADRMRKEAEDQANKLIAEARKQSDNIMQKARTEADELVESAKNRATKP